MQQRIILDHRRIRITLRRLAHQLVEQHGDFSASALIGLQPRGVLLSRILLQELKEITGNPEILYGELDTTFHRDDFRRGDNLLIPEESRIDFAVEGLNIILVDDVLYTGRSVRSAMDALVDFGRPKKTELLVLVDRRFNREMPIAPDYVGEVVDTRAADQKVRVEWTENDYKVWLITGKG